MYLTIKDIDECSLQQALCAGSCTNTPGSYICACPKGFTLNGRVCEGIIK